MALPKTVAEFLASTRTAYTTKKHPVAYTAQEIAAATHVPGSQLAKSVLIKTSDGFALAVLPATQRVDFKKLQALLKVKKVSIASEGDIKTLFPGMEVGAMPPFGNLYNVPMVVDTSLNDAETIVCNAGSHTETMSLRTADWLRLVKPKAGQFGVPPEGQMKKQAKTPKKKSSKKPAKQRKKPAKKPSKKPAKKKR